MDKTYSLVPVIETLHERFRMASTFYKKNPDPFGLNVEKFAHSFRLLLPLYEHYFRVRLFGIENIQNMGHTKMFISNHTGQLPIDGLLLAMATFLHSSPRPIILRGLGERFLMGLPFIGKFAMENGVILGDRKNCELLLKRNECVLTFPEGVRGISKSTSHFYRMQKFTLGFLRIALKYRTPIQPVVVIGAEEMYPYVWQAPRIAKFLKIPSFPITPFFPWFGLLGAIPMPSPVDIYFMKEVELPENLNSSLSDDDLMPFVMQLHQSMQKQIDDGRKTQRPPINIKKILSSPVNDYWLSLLGQFKALIFNKK